MLGQRLVTEPQLRRQDFDLLGPARKQLVPFRKLGLRDVQLFVALAQLRRPPRERLPIFSECDRESAGLLARSRESLLVLPHDALQFRVLGLSECDGLPLIAKRCLEQLAFVSQRLLLRDGEFQLSCDHLQLEARILKLSLSRVELSLQVRELDVADVEFVREPLRLDQPRLSLETCLIQLGGNVPQPILRSIHTCLRFGHDLFRAPRAKLPAFSLAHSPRSRRPGSRARVSAECAFALGE